jgi:hypothetical protein
VLEKAKGKGSPFVTASRETETSGDVALARAASRGDLCELYAPVVHGILLAHVPQDHVGDLMQEVFLAALERVHTLRDGAARGVCCRQHFLALQQREVLFCDRSCTLDYAANSLRPKDEGLAREYLIFLP